MKPRIKEVIVVEGRYDRNAIAQVVDATVVETGGFSVFNNREKLAFLRRLAEKRGLILLTDPDGAGFVIRNYLKGAIPRQQVKQAYIPDVAGKERRKRRPGQGGEAGRGGDAPGGAAGGPAALRRNVPGRGSSCPERRADQGGHDGEGPGGAGSAARRQQVLKELELPEHLTANGLLEAMNLLLSREEFDRL